MDWNSNASHCRGRSDETAHTRNYPRRAEHSHVDACACQRWWRGRCIYPATDGAERNHHCRRYACLVAARRAVGTISSSSHRCQSIYARLDRTDSRSYHRPGIRRTRIDTFDGQRGRRGKHGHPLRRHDPGIRRYSTEHYSTRRRGDGGHCYCGGAPRSYTRHRMRCSSGKLVGIHHKCRR